MNHDTPVPAVTSRLEVAGISDIGHKRTNNEDSFGYDLDANVFVVCDGMGGMSAGEVASSVAVEQALRAYRELRVNDMQLEECLQAAILMSNRAVWEMAESRQDLHGMGTTLVAACVEANHIVVGNVGDSRAYFVRDGGCVQITRDHSYRAQYAPGSDMVVPAPLRDLITRAVGVGPVVEPEFFVAELKPGDTVLLATDGLTRYVDADAVAAQVNQARDLQESCHNLVAIALAGGAEDNVTCLLVRIPEDRPSEVSPT
jgi:serine/threonine protein phosphatase PrpC